jgi:hypothetical protein
LPRHLFIEDLGGITTMKIRFAVPLALALFVTLPALAQRGEEHHDVHANQGHVPQAAPPHRDVHAKPEVERHEGAALTAFRM